MLAGSAPAWSTGFLAVAFVGSPPRSGCVIAFEPAAEIDLRAARRAERPVLRHRRLAADRARARCGSLDRRDGGHCRADIIKAPRFENVRAHSRDRPRSRCCGRIAARLARTASAAAPASAAATSGATVRRHRRPGCARAARRSARSASCATVTAVLTRAPPGARLEQCLGERAAAARPHQLEMAEPGPAEELRACRVGGERLGERRAQLFARRPAVQPDKIDDDAAAQIAQPDLPGDGRGGGEVGRRARCAPATPFPEFPCRRRSACRPGSPRNAPNRRRGARA